MDSVQPTEAVRRAFELAVLGSPRLRDGFGQVPAGLGSGKPLALLCFLIVRTEVRRDEALALLWGDVDEDRARNAFRQALHRLRLALGEDIVVGDRQVLKLASGAPIQSDVSAFERAIDDERFDDALALYRGDFLEGFDVGSHPFEEWAEVERRRLRARCRLAAERAAQRALAQGRIEMAERALRKLLEVAGSDPRSVEGVAAGFVSMGRRDAAAETLATFARRAADEGIPVPRSLQSMLDRLAPAKPPAAVAEHSRQPPFVGRPTELAKLLAIRNSLAAESGATIIVEGQAGIGKSRLLKEFMDSVRALGAAHVLHGVEAPGGFSAPYAAVATALRPLVHAKGIAGASPHLLAEAARLLPELRDAFQLPAVEPVEEETARLRVCEGIAALLESAAYERPVCLVVEDVEHTSERTLELLGYLASRLRRSPIALVLAFDSDAAERATAMRLRALAGGTGPVSGLSHHLALQPLASSDISDLVASALGDVPSSQRVQQIATIANGNPRRALELAGQRPIVAILQRQFPNWRYLLGGALASTVIAIVVMALAPSPVATALGTRDTLLVGLPEELSRGLVRFVTMHEGALVRSDARELERAVPSWADSIDLPWVNAMPSPSGTLVALERVTSSGSNLYLVSADRRDTIPLVTGDVEAFGMGWSPDGSTFLATRARRTGDDHRAALLAFSARRPPAELAIDTLAEHSVTEAVWSPDGTHVAWVARVRGGQEDVFLARADGSNRRNVSGHPARDYHLAWSPDGSLLAFTSRRDGNAELYAFDLLGDKLWRLTHDEAQDDRASFDRDGRFVAFESTRDGSSDVYVMPSLGGDAVRVGDSTSALQIVGWRRSAPRYLDRLEFGVSPAPRLGDTAVVVLRGLDQLGAPLHLWQSQWRVVDPDLLRAVSAGDPPSERRFVALKEGLARIHVSVGAWRSDTAFVRTGSGLVSILDDDFGEREPSSAWRTVGSPLPGVGPIAGDRSALLLNADRQGESGVLSAAAIPLYPGLVVEATLLAPFDSRSAAMSATLALVSARSVSDADGAARRFPPRVSISWNAAAGRVVYAVDRDVFDEAVPAGTATSARKLRTTVNADGTVTFWIDDVPRWTSTIRVLRSDRATTTRLWLGGLETGTRVGFGSVRVTLKDAVR